jgi:phage terminase large subunit-like protein
LIVVDDLEDKKSVQNEELRKELKKWFFSDVLNSVDRGKKNWKIVVIGTLLHEDSLLSNLMEDPTWHHVHLSLCDDKFRSLWPEFMTDKEVMELVESHRVQGILDEFYQEYMGVPQSKEAAKFMAEHFRYYDSEAELNKNENIENVIICDPASTTTGRSDSTAIIAAGIDVTEGRIYIRDIVSLRLHPDELYEMVFNMAKTYNVRAIGLKVTSLNEFITYPFKTAMTQRGVIYEIVEIKERAKKNDRIGMLVPFYRRGLVYHNRANCGGLEAQLLSYPRSKRDDIMDCVADVIPMLDSGERFFMPTGSGKPINLEGVVPEDSDDDADYIEAYSDSIGKRGNWRLM